MDKTIIAIVSFVAGAGVGIAVGYYISKNGNSNLNEYVEPVYTDQPKKSEPEKSQEVKFEIKPARLAKKPGDVGINYNKLNKDLQYLQESESPQDDDPDDEYDQEGLDMSDYEETYEERVEREREEVLEHAEAYKKENKGKIELMTQDDWDTDFPENDYEREDLYYFTESDILTDEDGNTLDEEEFIGAKPRQVGWMRSPEENIYVRNHRKEKEYRIFKERCTVEDWF